MYASACNLNTPSQSGQRWFTEIKMWMVLKLSVTEVLQRPVCGKQTKCFGSVYRKGGFKEVIFGF